MTNYSLAVPSRTWVVLTAPDLDPGTTYRFVRWWYNGYPISNATINFSMSSSVTAVAEYALPSASAKGEFREPVSRASEGDGGS